MAAPAAEPTNYAELYTSLSGSATNANFLVLFDEAAAAVTPAEMLTTIMSASSATPKMIVYCTGTVDRPVIRHAHRLSVYSPALGSPSPWDGRKFAFSGDLGAGGSIQPVTIPDNLFHRTALVHVPNQAAMVAELTAALAAGLPCLGPYVAGPTVEQIRTLSAMAVPPQYVAFVMEQEEYTPLYFLTRLAAKIEADGELANCVKLVNWARVAATYATANISPLVNLQVAPPLSDSRLRNRIWEWVCSDIPKARQDATPVAQQLLNQTAVLQQLAAMANAHNTRAVTAAANAGRPKSLAELNIATEALFRICRSTTEAELPGFWKAFLNSSKSSQAATLTQHLQAEANGEHGNNTSPSVTPELLILLRSFAFIGVDKSDLKSGLSVFQVIVTLNGRSDAATRTNSFNLLWANETSGPRREDLAILTAKAPPFPTTAHQAIKTVEGYVTLLATVLGTSNNDVIAIRAWSREITTKLGELDQSFTNPAVLANTLARFLVQVHYSMHAFFERLVRGADPPSPNLTYITEVFERNTFDTLATIPAEYLAAPIPAPTGIPNAGRGGPGRGAGTPPGGQGSGVQRGVTNMQPHLPMVERYKTLNKPIGELVAVAGVQPPFVEGQSSGRTNQICLHYHLNAVCRMQNCGRANSHRLLTIVEQANVQQFLTNVGASA